MNGQTASDAIDTRTVFRIYKIAAWLTGALLFAWGPLFFRLDLVGYPYAGGFVVRVVGAIVIAAGCFAHAVTMVDDPEVRRRVLGWWAQGHVHVSLLVALQILAVLSPTGPGSQIALAAVLTVTILLLHVWWTADGLPQGGLRPLRSVLGMSGEPSVQRLRSAYEEQIRAAASQEERNRLARDLHDSVKQQIFAIHTAAATAQARLAADQAGASEAIEQVRSSAREAMTEMEVMLDQLRAAPLENAGLVEALKKQCEALRFRTGAEVRFALGELPPSENLPPGAHDAVFRVAQEALANVGRHARAAHVSVTLDSTPHSLQLRMDDDGTGFATEPAGAGMGLGNMRARAAAVGGTLTVTSQPGQGTLVRLSIPRVITAGDDIGYYRRGILFGGMGLFFWVAFVVWSAREQSPVTLILTVPIGLFFAVVLARKTAGYLRLRRQRKVR